ncbi:MAG: flavodoxin family protein [Clostridia bacterium]|nr:flavodoxin family protein [Clostridia bacterium]
MNILVLNGSPKEKSDTMHLTRSFLQGLNEDGEHAITIIDVIKKHIRPCIGCFQCWQRGDSNCVLQDDQNEILAAYRAADVIIWSFPLYCYGMPSHLKAVLDRTIPLVQMRMVTDGDTVRHESLIDFSQKKTIVISGCGFPAWEGNFDGLRKQCQVCFGHPIILCVPETPLLNTPEAAPLAQPLLENFRRAGQEFAKHGFLAHETIAELETPMMPKEDYIAALNERC